MDTRLDDRKQQVLSAVVSDYTQTAVPVGSAVLAAKYLASWSSATIRSELANLVEVGYLLQPHTSAGRVPTDLGYRYYVDFLMDEEQLPLPVQRQLDEAFAEPATTLEQALETAAQALAVAAGGVSVVSGPRSLGAKMKHIDLVALDQRHALLLLVLDGNLIRQQTIDLSQSTTQDQLSMLAATLNTELARLDSGAINKIELGESSPSVRKDVLRHVVEFMKLVDERQDTVIVHDGVRNLLREPEFGDVERLQQVMDVVEEERTLGGVLASLELDNGVHMLIGTENGVDALRECSLVLTSYRASETGFGTIGVLGPTRMRYAEVAPRLRFVAKKLGESIERMLG
jgi:heat-inducible transcriptional repressor